MDTHVELCAISCGLKEGYCQSDFRRVSGLLGVAPVRLRKMGLESYRITAEEINLEQMAASFVRAVNHVQQEMQLK